MIMVNFLTNFSLADRAKAREEDEEERHRKRKGGKASIPAAKRRR
jgi:hypothetical protein